MGWKSLCTYCLRSCRPCFQDSWLLSDPEESFSLASSEGEKRGTNQSFTNNKDEQASDIISTRQTARAFLHRCTLETTHILYQLYKTKCQIQLNRKHFSLQSVKAGTPNPNIVSNLHNRKYFYPNTWTVVWQRQQKPLKQLEVKQSIWHLVMSKLRWLICAPLDYHETLERRVMSVATKHKLCLHQEGNAGANKRWSALERGANNHK